MRRIQFSQSSEVQAVKVEFGKKQVAAFFDFEDGNLNLILQELKKPLNYESVETAKKYNDRFVHFAFDDEKSIDVVIDWLQNLKTIYKQKNECK